MAMGEFELIRQFFASHAQTDTDVVVGVGDDAAVINVPAGYQLVVSTDTLVSGRHFPHDTSAYDIGWKSLAVNLSDMAAMGATPRWFSLGLTLPGADSQWLAEFSRGLLDLADRHGVRLIGGDTTSGPVLVITVTIQGLVPKGEALLRSGAQPGDGIYVSGTVGDAAAGLDAVLNQREAPALVRRLNQPEPQIDLGQKLRNLATSAMDISDGLVQDLGHILERSGVGASIKAAALPLSPAFRDYCGEDIHWQWPLAGGDDYELLVTLPGAIAGAEIPAGLTRIGTVEAEPGLRCELPDGQLWQGKGGFDHFKVL